MAAYGFPDWGAHSYQVARMASGFRAIGQPAVIVRVPGFSGLPWDEIPAVYGVPAVPPRYDVPGGGPVTGRVPVLRGVLRRLGLGALAVRAAAGDVILARHATRDPLRLVLRARALGLVRARIIVELHEIPHHDPAADRLVDGYVVIHEHLRQHLVNGGFPDGRILLAPSAVDLDAYELAREWDRATLRRELQLPADAPVVCYTGRLSASRNVEILIGALAHLPAGACLVLIGDATGSYGERLVHLASAQRGHIDVRLPGRLPAEATRRYQMASDVLVFPYGDRLAAAPKYSPLKLGEYLATGLPIAAFRTPSLAATLSDDDVVWAAEETPEAMAAAITSASRRAPRSREQVRTRLAGASWPDRARAITAFAASLPEGHRG